MSKTKGQKPCKTQPKTKMSKVVTLLKGRSGVTVAQITKVTDWQAHSVRAALTRLRQQGIDIERESVKGVSRYRIPQRRAS